MTHRLYILWPAKLIIGIFGRDYGGITIPAGAIRSRKRTPTQDLGSPLLDHFINRHMQRDRIGPSTAPPHTDCTSQGGWASEKYHSRPVSKILLKRDTPPHASSSVNGCRRQVSGGLFPSLRLRHSGRPLQSNAILMACQVHENKLYCQQVGCPGQLGRCGDICLHKAREEYGYDGLLDRRRGKPTPQGA
jgi:hypothetical protein